MFMEGGKVAPARMSADVFISYSRKNTAEAEKIERRLQQAGIHCYRDTQLVPGTPEWEEEIVRAVGECSILVVLLSTESVGSKFVRRELILADDQGKGCIPVCFSRDLDLKQLTLRLASNQRLYAEPSVEAVLDELERSVWIALDAINKRAAHEASKLVAARATRQRKITFSQERFGLWCGESDRGGQKLVGDSYVFSTRPDVYLGSMMTELPQMTDIAVEVRASKANGPGGNWFGVEYGDPWPGNYYQLLLNGHGAVRVAKHWNGSWTELGTCESVRFAARGNAVNNFKVVRRGDAIHLFLNGLHAFSTRDADIKSGKLGFVAGPELTVGFSDLKLAAVELDTRFEKCLAHWESLEILEARSIAREILAAVSNYRHPKHPVDLGRIAAEFRADRRWSILIVLGYKVLPQIHDARPAKRLMETINRQGTAGQLKYSLLVTDKGLVDETVYQRCPLISIGGPESNCITATLCEQLPTDLTSTTGSHIQHDIEHGDRRVALWGDSAEATDRAVDQFISTGLLQRFLDMLWKE